MSSSALTGWLTFRLRLQRGRVTKVKIVSARLQAAVLLTGKTPEQAMQLVPLLFSLCGGAQGVAAQAALQAAQGMTPAAAQQACWAGTVRREASVEHLWHLMLDWPKIFGLERYEEEYVRCRHQCLQAKTDSDHAAALETVMVSELLGMPSADWLSRDQPAWAAWRKDSSALGAKLLRRLEDVGGEGGLAAACLPCTIAEDWVGLEQKIRTPAYCSTPTWLGQPRETGALARQRGHALVAPLLAAGRNIEARLTARLVELAHWACGEAGPARDWIDVARCGQNTGLARVETARGILVHRVLVENGAIGEYAIVAPTEWNFHPHGAFAREAGRIAEPDDAAALRQAQWLALSLDPCVAYEVALEPP
ncbi:MAG TPA: nickel-dependent hydrogenase large subunit [Sulfuricella sp.]|nr:nickel-dependent hydrogenase large subunit [Sulfuricella sp.]